MYGIEYSTFASLIQDEELRPTDNKLTESNLNTSTTDISYINNASNESQHSQAESIIHRLQSLSKVPDYLKPNLFINSTINECSNKSSLKNQYRDDFILLSEFSEIEGPKPLLTIPTDGGTGFNKNEYALHLMCVDFHSHTHHQNNSDKRFTFTKDTSIINFWDLNIQVTSCIQHFTLYDIEARGYVRPFCMAYISYDQKSFEFFEQIKEKFGQVTELFRKNNLVQFKNELENKCSDLNYTRDIFLKWCELNSNQRIELQQELDLDEKTFLRLNSASSCENSINIQLKTIENLLKETQDILEVTIDELRKKNWFKKKLSNSTIMSSSNNLTNKNRSFTFPLSSEDNLTIRIDNLRTEEVYKPSMCYQSLTGSYTLPINIESNLKKDRQKVMKKLHQLCPETAKLAINQLRLTHRYFSTPLYLLKYKKLTNNKQSLKKNLFWSLTAGDCFISDFSLNSDTTSLNKTILERKSITEVDTLTNSTKNRTEFFSPKNDPTEKTVYLDAKSFQTETTIKNYSWSNLEHFLDLNEDSQSLDHDSLSVNETEFCANQEILYEDSDEESSKKELNEYDFANSLLAIDNKFSSTNSLAVSLSSSSVGLFYKALNNLRFQSCLTDKIVQFQEFNFEENLKNLINNFPLIFPHLIYSILKGRPVICVSRYCSNLLNLQSVVDCLSNFVPNSFYCLNSLFCRNTPKFTSSPHGNVFGADKPKLKSIHERKPIRLNDLKYCKLFGLSLMIRESCTLESHKHYEREDVEDLLLTYIPITVRNYVTILDLDNLTFSGPKYTGNFLTNAIMKCKSLNRDSVLYLFLITNVLNFYTKLAFVYNYSILFEHNNPEIDQFLVSNKRSLNLKRPSQVSTTSSHSGSFNRKDKLMKFFSNKKETSKSIKDAEFERLKNFVTYIYGQQINFDVCDFKIVTSLVNSLKMKQIYLYNLAIHKKELKELNKIKKNSQDNEVPLIQLSINNTSSEIEASNKMNSCNNQPQSADIQIPLIVEYEEIHFITNKK